MKKVRWHRIGANLLLSLCALIVFLIIAEFVIRPIKGYPVLPIVPPSPYVDRARLYQETPNRLFELRPNLVDRATHPKIALNSHGMRDREYPLQKPPGVFRIAVLGDSFTFSGGVPVNQVYVKQLEALLNADGGARRYEALNFGVPGYNSEQERYMLEEKALAFDPDLVLVGFVLNDALPTSTLAVGKRLIPPKIREGLKRSYLFLTVYEAFSKTREETQRLPGGETSPLNEGKPGWDASKAALRRMKEIIEARGGKLAVAIFPMFESPIGEGYRFAEQHETVRRACEDLGITCLDLRSAYSGYTPQQLMLSKTDAHPNVLANGIAAQAIYDFLKARGFVLRIGGQVVVSALLDYRADDPRRN